MSKITIFTPTFNREKELDKLYNSLIKQTNKKFVWLIVDDGSEDKTKELIESYIKEDKLKIEYIYQKNSGKYIAHNTAVKNCKTDYFFCVDSDDYLNDNAINKIYEYLEKKEICKNNNIIGIFFPKKNVKGEYYKIELNNILLDIPDLKFIYNKNIETAIVFKTDVIKKVLFPEYKNCKFMSEEIIYNKLSLYGKLLFINDNEIYYYEYLENGLTNNIYSLWCKNFDSTITLLKSRYDFLNKYNIKIRIFNKIKTIISINVICIINEKKLLKYTPSKIVSLLLIIPSLIWRKIKYKL